MHTILHSLSWVGGAVPGMRRLRDILTRRAIIAYSHFIIKDIISANRASSLTRGSHGRLHQHRMQESVGHAPGRNQAAKQINKVFSQMAKGTSRQVTTPFTVSQATGTCSAMVRPRIERKHSSYSLPFAASVISPTIPSTAPALASAPEATAIAMPSTASPSSSRCLFTPYQYRIFRLHVDCSRQIWPN